jgi:hypothetical protein
MNLDDMMNAAAASIGAMPETELAIGLEQLEADYQACQLDDVARARRAALLDSLDLEQAAYELGQQYDQVGNLRKAAHWYRVAANGDHGDAALRLAITLDLLADRCANAVETGACHEQREEHDLIQAAAMAYVEAYAAGYSEAVDKLDDMLASFSRRQSAQAPANGQNHTDTPAATAPERNEPCSYVRDCAPTHGVLRDEVIRQLSEHAARCLTCLRDFTTLAQEAAAGAATGTITNPYGHDDHAAEVASASRRADAVSTMYR